VRLHSPSDSAFHSDFQPGRPGARPGIPEAVVVGMIPEQRDEFFAYRMVNGIGWFCVIADKAGLATSRRGCVA